MKRLAKPSRDTRRGTEQKFWDYVEKLPSGCWRWIGACQVMSWQGEQTRVRRIAWAIAFGHLPERRLYPRCRKNDCISPHHAYLQFCGEDAPAIAAAWRSGETHAAIAGRYGCTRETVSRFIAAHLVEQRDAA